MKLTEGIVGVLCLVAFGFAVFGCYWAAKNLSYSFFYESLVQETIQEMVKPGSLR